MTSAGNASVIEDVSNELTNILAEQTNPGCGDYKVLNDSSRKYSSGIGGQKSDNEPNNDWAGEGWYRVMEPAGTRIYSSKPEKDETCGTYYPGGIKVNIIPDAGETVNNVVCLSGSTSYCEETVQIKVKNCGRFYLYYLPKLLSYTRYCTE